MSDEWTAGWPWWGVQPKAQGSRPCTMRSLLPGSCDLQCWAGPSARGILHSLFPGLSLRSQAVLTPHQRPSLAALRPSTHRSQTGWDLGRGPLLASTHLPPCVCHKHCGSRQPLPLCVPTPDLGRRGGAKGSGGRTEAKSPKMRQPGLRVGNPAPGDNERREPQGAPQSLAEEGGGDCPPPASLCVGGLAKHQFPASTVPLHSCSDSWQERETSCPYPLLEGLHHPILRGKQAPDQVRPHLLPRPSLSSKAAVPVLSQTCMRCQS